MSGDVTRRTLPSATCRSTWQPTPQYGHTERTILSGWRTCSGAKRSRGITSKIAPVGQTRTHSPHQVQPALPGATAAPTADALGVAATGAGTRATPGARVAACEEPVLSVG